MRQRDIDFSIKNCTDETVLRDSTGERNVGTLTLVVRRRKSVTTATWVALWQADGTRHKKTLGRYPDLDLNGARAAFIEKVREPLLAGRNPQHVAEKHARPTVEALFQAYVADLRAKGKVSADNFEFTLLRGKTNCADGIGRHKLAADVTPGDVIAALRQWYDRGCRRQADIARANMVAAFNHGLQSANTYTTANRADWGLKSNPAHAVKKDTGAIQPRDRNLSADELREFWQGLNDYNFTDDMADLFRLLVICGQRVRETLMVDGREIDLVNKVWNMPREKTKGRKHPHVVPLSDMAVAVFSRLIVRNGLGPLFPGGRGGKRARISEMSVAQSVRRWCDEYGFPKFQPRDLRRTWKSRAHDAGVDRFTRDLIQQHAKNDTGSRHYDRAEYGAQMREGMVKWDAWLQRVLAAPEHAAGALPQPGAVHAQAQA